MSVKVVRIETCVYGLVLQSDEYADLEIISTRSGAPRTDILEILIRSGLEIEAKKFIRRDTNGKGQQESEETGTGEVQEVLSAKDSEA